MDRHEVLRHAAETQPLAGFRDQYTYWNIGFVVAAEAMARAAGRPFETLLEERLLAPLGMSATKVAPDAWKRAANIAVPHHQVREVPGHDHIGTATASWAPAP
jgi:CubicO group peptidase (beta-lactamase class C family)